jgi:hypothetical protein
MKRRTVLSALVICLVGVVLSSTSANAGCWSHYRETTLAKHLAQFPLGEYERWNHYAYSFKDEIQFAISYMGSTPEGAEVSVPLLFSGEIRAASPTAKQAVGFFGGEKVEKLFNHELHVVEKGFDGWVLVQDVLVPGLEKELKKGERFIGCLVLIGRTNTYQLYIMNEFEKTESNPALQRTR